MPTLINLTSQERLFFWNSSEDFVGLFSFLFFCFFFLLDRRRSRREKKERTFYGIRKGAVSSHGECRKSFSLLKISQGWLILSLVHLFHHFQNALLAISLTMYSEKMDFVLSKRHETSRGKGDNLFILYSMFKIVPSYCDQITKYKQASIRSKYCVVMLNAHMSK